MTESFENFDNARSGGSKQSLTTLIDVLNIALLVKRYSLYNISVINNRAKTKTDSPSEIGRE